MSIEPRSWMPGRGGRGSGPRPEDRLDCSRVQTQGLVQASASQPKWKRARNSGPYLGSCHPPKMPHASKTGRCRCPHRSVSRKDPRTMGWELPSWHRARRTVQGSRMRLASDDLEHGIVVPGRHVAPAALAGSTAAIATRLRAILRKGRDCGRQGGRARDCHPRGR